MNTASALLSIRDLVVDTTGPGVPTRLVDGFRLDMAGGERVALVGESGSGKTLVARSIMRLTSGLRVAGSIRLGFTELTGLSEAQMRAVRGRRIGMVFQDPMTSLDPLMTVGAQIAEPLRIAGVGKKAAMRRAAAALSDLGVVNAAARLSAYPHEFSGGMRQRVALAMALVAEPELLIADEPTTALDVRVQEQVLDLLDRVATERRLAVLMITHDLSVVAGFSDRVTVMYAGQHVHDDDVHRLFAAPAHPYTATLLDAVPRLQSGQSTPRSIPGSPPHPTERPSGCAFHPRCPYAADVCRTTSPTTLRLGGGGVVRCHRPLSDVEGVARAEDRVVAVEAPC